MPTRTVSVQLTLPSILSYFLTKLAVNILTSLHIFCHSLWHFTPSFPCPPLSCHEACCFQADGDEIILNINHYYNCPLRKARRDSPAIHLCPVRPDSPVGGEGFHLGASSERMLMCYIGCDDEYGLLVNVS